MIGLGLRLKRSHAGLESAHDGQRVAPCFPEVHNGGNKEVNLFAGRTYRSEIKTCRQYTDDGHGAIDGGGIAVDLDGLSDDVGVRGELEFSRSNS